MKIIINGFTSADLEDLEAFRPPPTLSWIAQADVTLALEGEVGGDIFQFLICSEAYVRERLSESAVSMGRTIIFREYTFEALQQAVQVLIEESVQNARTWDDFARNVNWHMQWEFENYREGPP